eukprot:5385949-Pleurochrysis_carterae.AAC.1
MAMRSRSSGDRAWARARVRVRVCESSRTALCKSIGKGDLDPSRAFSRMMPRADRREAGSRQRSQQFPSSRKKVRVHARRKDRDSPRYERRRLTS